LSFAEFAETQKIEYTQTSKHFLVILLQWQMLEAKLLVDNSVDKY